MERLGVRGKGYRAVCVPTVKVQDILCASTQAYVQAGVYGGGALSLGVEGSAYKSYVSGLS